MASLGSKCNKASERSGFSPNKMCHHSRNTDRWTSRFSTHFFYKNAMGGTESSLSFFYCCNSYLVAPKCVLMAATL